MDHEHKKTYVKPKTSNRIPSIYLASLPDDRQVSRHPGNNGRSERQLEWEKHYLELAAKNGCIIFWLPVEDNGYHVVFSDTIVELVDIAIEKAKNLTHF